MEPFISSKRILPELTVAPLMVGVILGIIFGASSLYLALKVGMTVSASIPVAVLSITLFKSFSKMFGLRQATILENNIVQTTGSAGESIAFGVAVTMPALLILGYEMELGRIMLVAVLGGLLGVLMMIPLRRTLIVQEHGKLSFPEGTACAQVLIVGEQGGTTAKTVFFGFFTGLFYKILNVGSKLWTDTPSKMLSFFPGAQVAAEVSPELLGVGYIIGPRTASIMVGGGILSSFVLIPMIKLFGDGLSSPLFPATMLIRDMDVHQVWRNYVLYIGAGAVAAGGIISLAQSLPTIISSARVGLSKVGNLATRAETMERTDLDLSLKWVGLGCLILILAITAAPSLHMNILGAILILVFGFLFVTVSSRLTGEIGSSSNPISGMTVATLLITSLVFLALGWVDGTYRVTALSVAAIVCVAASNAGTTSQDLKAGYLVGATPRSQQIALLIGALTSALVIGFTLKLLNDASTVYTQKNLPNVTIPDSALSGEVEKEYRVLRVTEMHSDGPLAGLIPGKYWVGADSHLAYRIDPGINGNLSVRDDGSPVQKYEAPKARLMSLIIDGILTRKLPWGLVLLGVSIAFVLELCGISALPFAVGVYLPLSASSPIFIGGLLRWWVDRRKKKPKTLAEEESSPGILYSSGLIAGGAIAGIGLALLSLADGVSRALDLGKYFPVLAESSAFAFGMFILLCFALVRAACYTEKE